MIVAPNFLDHWKTKMLQVELGGDLLAPTYVLRLWGHCQLQKTHKFHRLSASALSAICGYAGEPGRFWLAIQNSGFVEVDGETVIARHWDEYNASLLTAWANGAKGGRPAHNPPVSQSVARRVVQEAAAQGFQFGLTPDVAPIAGKIQRPTNTPRARDLIFETLAEVECSDIARLTKSGRGKLNKATAEIRAAEPGVTPDRVKLAAKNWAKKYPTAQVSATALASHWSKLTPPLETEAHREHKTTAAAERRAARDRLEQLRDQDTNAPRARPDLTEEERLEYIRLGEFLQRSA